MHQDLVAEVRPVILTLMGAVWFVMLIACANVANLLLVRAAARERELAVRAALGGSRLRLVRQLLVESVLLAGLAAMAGILLARFGIDLFIAMGPENLPRMDRVGIDPTVVALYGRGRLVSARDLRARAGAARVQAGRHGPAEARGPDEQPRRPATGCAARSWCWKSRSRSCCWWDRG